MEILSQISTLEAVGAVAGFLVGVRLSYKLFKDVFREGGCSNGCLVAGIIGLLPPVIGTTAGLAAAVGIEYLLGV